MREGVGASDWDGRGERPVVADQLDVGATNYLVIGIKATDQWVACDADAAMEVEP